MKTKASSSTTSSRTGLAARKRPELPAPDAGSSAFFAPSEGSAQASIGAGCVKVDYKSLNPGLARIRAVVRNAAGTIVYSHQFLVIWLTVNKPTLSEVAAENGVPFVPSSYLGDPSGNGEFVPSPFSEPEANTDKGLVQVKVTGSFPVEEGSALHNILPEASYTLPESWPTLAARWRPVPKNWNRRAPTRACGTSTAPSEATTFNAEEPGNNPLTRLLPAGVRQLHLGRNRDRRTVRSGGRQRNAPQRWQAQRDDAPMPAIRVDVHLAPNEGGTTWAAWAGSRARARP